MKPKYILINYNFEPNPTNSKIQTFEDLSSLTQDIINVDFVAEDGDTKIARDVSKIGDNIESNLNYLLDDEIGVFSADFETKYNLYVGLAANGLIDEPFPFKSWADEIQKLNSITKNKVNIDIYNVLEGILEIKNNNTNDDGIAQMNLAYFLVSDLDEDKVDGKYYLTLKYLVKHFNKDITLEEVLNCKNFTECMKVLSETFKTSPLDEISLKTMKYALTMLTDEIDTKLSFDEAVKIAAANETNKNKLPELKKICENFKNSSLWKIISNNDSELDRFFSKFATEHLSAKTFFQLDSIQNYPRLCKIKKIKHDSIYAFVETIIDGNEEMASKLLTHVEKSVPSYNKSLTSEFNELKDKVISLTNYYNLNNNLIENQIQQPRKMKI